MRKFQLGVGTEHTILSALKAKPLRKTGCENPDSASSLTVVARSLAEILGLCSASAFPLFSAVSSTQAGMEEEGKPRARK